MAGAESTILEAAEQIHYPALGLFGGDDQNIPVDQVHALDEALDKAGADHEVIIYPGAPHSFFDRRAEVFAKESADAWQRVLGFIAAHSTKQ